MKWQKKLSKRQKNFQYKITQYPKDLSAPEKSARILEKGGLIIFPTKGVYGIGADIHNNDAVKKIYQIKKRDFAKPLLILINNIEDVEKYCTNIPSVFFTLMKDFWPGDITFIMEASKHVPEILTGKTGKIGVRIPAHPFLKELQKFFKSPITGTSANISTQPATDIFEELNYELIEKSDFLIKSNETGSKIPSTILESTNQGIKVLRQGRVSTKDLKKHLIMIDK